MNRFDCETVIPTFHGGVVIAITTFTHTTNQTILAKKTDSGANNIDCRDQNE